MWLIAIFLLFSCSTEKVKEKEVEWIPAQPIPKTECPACPTCPLPPPSYPPNPQDPTPVPTPYPGQSAIVKAINAARRIKGLGEVFEDTKLNCAAINHAKDIAPRKICGHIGSDGSQFWQRAQKCGAQALGEIVACGYPNAVSAVEGWDRSPGHAAIMYGQYGKVGVAEVDGYWVAVFAE